eukprot:CAMPEP_0184722766 /NCGR_PEP_ID=MMETSP0314-20130426/23189_1 /TAXON_ID=38298 /ORGANISM="Rhodella maculata, Strain CCMP 736" /LENGTH=84 /DNA_ID=CAMNT_0027187429 /DNA_START=372 /DNA_END=624 /DNA_ORIENTATION=-
MAQSPAQAAEFCVGLSGGAGHEGLFLHMNTDAAALASRVRRRRAAPRSKHRASLTIASQRSRSSWCSKSHSGTYLTLVTTLGSP